MYFQGVSTQIHCADTQLPVVDTWFDPAIADRAHDVLGGRLLDVDRGIGPTDLDGVVGVTAPGHREVVVGGETFDPLAGAGMFAVDLRQSANK